MAQYNHLVVNRLYEDDEVSEILSRKRSLTLEMIRKLNQELRIPAEILIQPYELVQTPAQQHSCT
ncbi:hypothetical protein IQ230_24200 [Gloeocapsopsis crepidinum LEGE 06123]|uniref:Transcriptional regulator n=1 Tax=Gloeocapsopsis crepidinum LEGE 06123 TaxID=588587 RepID=A0ABR9V1L4_9CHRO|nr:hypothetical protein [Gloeocapsopsis crepidinum]MBE9193388.1 hypothetical protein [Gloeocapsopsis crepidinum LEGE 06123]